MTRAHLLFTAAILSACTTTTPTPPQLLKPQATVPPPASAMETRTSKLQRYDGFIPLFWDAENGKLLMQISRFGEEMIYQVSLPSGLGSNPVGLDRGEMGQTLIVVFERIGPKVLMIAPNYRFRAISDDPNETRAVTESFPRSVIASFKVEVADGNTVLVDATDFFINDTHRISQRLRGAQQGSYSLDRNRSAIYLPRTKAFPRNTEVEVLLTFATTDRPGNYVSAVAPSPDSITLREHHSLVALPEPGYKPRRVDPRVGVFGIDFFDYASPFTERIDQHWIARHRLEKKDPEAVISEPVKPIVYYVDPGAPEPIRSALVEGAAWWDKAFQAAGFRDAFQVRLLPPDADPMDVRYNMINWVHRAQRGWSYGGAVIDPRTGEIIKGNVTLGSLRIRQDVMIASGLIPQFDELEGRTLGESDPATSPALMALARIRQLSAHETGHTLGLDHNMAASSYERASVMDYPAPYVKIVDGKLDLSEAYTSGVGPYDEWAVRYAYSQFPPSANEEEELSRIISEGLLFVTDPEARNIGAAHPHASVWDAPGDPVAMLRHEIEVRRIALSQFGLRNIGVGTPLANLEEILVPLFLHHRYQLEAAAKSIGGVAYTYSVKESGKVEPQPTRRIVTAERQRDALRAVLSTLDASFLEVPQRIVDLIPPRGNVEVTTNTELFERHTSPSFDPLDAARASIDITLATLLSSSRAARMNRFHAEDEAYPGFLEVLRGLIDVATRNETGVRTAIRRETARLFATRAMELANDRDADAQVRAEANEALRLLSSRLAAATTDDSELAHRRALRDDIERFLTRPDQPRTQPRPPAVPPGPPIGN